MMLTLIGLETEPQTRLGRYLVQTVTRPIHEEAFEAGFDGTADSALLNQRLGWLNCLRWERSLEACATSRPPTPNDRIGWPGSGFLRGGLKSGS